MHPGRCRCGTVPALVSDVHWVTYQQLIGLQKAIDFLFEDECIVLSREEFRNQKRCRNDHFSAQLLVNEFSQDAVTIECCHASLSDQWG